MFIPYIHTNNSVTLIIDGIPTSIDKAHHNYEIVLQKLDTSSYTSIEEALEDTKPIVMFNKAIAQSDVFYVNELGQIYLNVDGYPYYLPSELQEEVLRVNKAVGDLQPLANFVTKLARNPYKDVADQLFRFIQVCGLALTKDGDFLAYKNVREDFKDIYTGTMDNSPGSIVKMPRHAVEKNPDKTCSAGLHFAAWGYLSSYGSGRKTVIVKISPENVISIPTDYNNMKGRACEYTILKEVEQPEELKNRVVFDYDDEDFDDFYYSDDEDFDDFYYSDDEDLY